MSTNPYQQGRDADQANQQGGYYGGYQPQQNNQPDSQQYGGYQQSNTGSEDYQYGQHTYGQQQQQQQQQQQYNTYQPPASARARAFGGTGTGEPTSTGWSARREAVVSYLGFFITGIVFFAIERRNRFVRFCATQSTLLFGSIFIVYLLLNNVIAGFLGFIPLIGPVFVYLIGLVTGVLGIVTVALWIFLMIQAYRGVKVKLPFFGDLAERLSGGKR